MATTRAAVHLEDAPPAALSPYVFGALTEHFGRGLYGGLWTAERDAPRADVQNAVRAMGTTMFRYPGGCFSDWYHWRDGVGPREKRPTYEHQYWTDFRMGDAFTAEMAREFGPVETNAVGTDEFLQYCLDVDVEPMLVANFGSGTPEEAAAWVAHTNRGGAPRPVRWWSVGNETYGNWEIGHCSAEEYADGYRAFAEAMRAVDPSIRIVAVGCGGLGPEGSATAWNRTVLQRAGEHVDALSVHFYFPGPVMGRTLRDDEADYLQLATGSDELGTMLDGVLAECDGAGMERPVPLSLDEWNLWADWPDLIVANHPLCTSVFFAGCWNRIIERAARVPIAMISHQVNCMAPIQTRGERSFGTASFLVGMMYRRAARSHTAAVRVEADTVTAPPFTDVAGGDEVPLVGSRTAAAIDAAATRDAGGTAVFVANRRIDGATQVTVTGLPRGGRGRLRHLWAASGDPFARNDENNPAAIGFRDVAIDVDDAGRAVVELPPHTAGVVEVLA